ncbi:phosphatidate cytidylyltransferase [Anaeramoeba flamelloides]|uniref:Multifunctional fusion protein n=1 Tax=Anaeramoeba flamelloides TaxID=1746091 RepID=A0ABQ8Y333_9EUKA|nr:phosphatidate cytidylyltransferase [Anaeramoeba flamelloides]
MSKKKERKNDKIGSNCYNETNEKELLKKIHEQKKNIKKFKRLIKYEKKVRSRLRKEVKTNTKQFKSKKLRLKKKKKQYHSVSKKLIKSRLEKLENKLCDECKRKVKMNKLILLSNTNLGSVFKNKKNKKKIKARKRIKAIKKTRCVHKLCNLCFEKYFQQAIESQKIFKCPFCKDHQISLPLLERLNFRRKLEDYKIKVLSKQKKSNHKTIIYCINPGCRKSTQIEKNLKHFHCPNCKSAFFAEKCFQIRELYEKQSGLTYKQFLNNMDLGIIRENSPCNENKRGLVKVCLQKRTSFEYKSIKKLFLETWTKVVDDNQKIFRKSKIISIFSVHNPKKEQLFQEYRKQIKLRRSSDPNVKRLWHGTKMLCQPKSLLLCDLPNCVICNILQSGFILKRNKKVKKNWLRFGNGIYFASNSSKSHAYSSKSQSNLKRNYSVLLLCDVVCGKSKQYKKSQPDLQDPPKGYDSVHGVVGIDLNYDEYVVYYPDSAIPRNNKKKQNKRKRANTNKATKAIEVSVEEEYEEEQFKQIESNDNKKKDKRDNKENKETTEKDSKQNDKKEEEEAKAKKEKFKTRTKSTLLLIGILFFIFYMGHVYVALSLVLITIFSFREVILLSVETQREKKLGWANKSFPYLFLFSLVYYLYGKFLLERYSNWLLKFSFLAIFSHYHTFISYTLYIVCFILFVASLEKGHYKYQFKKLSWCLMALVLIVWQTNVMIRNLLDGLVWVLLPITLIFINDIAAYLWGISFGKHPLIKLSPKKTWEGFIGAFFTTLISAFFIAKLYNIFDYMVCPLENLDTPVTTCERHYVFQPQEYSLPLYAIDTFAKIGINLSDTIELLPLQLHSMILAVFASLIAPFGGFFASGLKRAINIKDFADTIPGHGGLVDRFDCHWVMGFFAYVYINTFILNSSDNISPIISKIKSLDDEQLKIISDNLSEIVQNRLGI